MDKTKNVTAQYTFFQKMLAVVLLFSVLTTTFLTSNLGLEGLLGKSVKAKVDGVITSFINVPDEITKVDAGIAKEKIVFPKIIGANVEKDGITKKVYFNAVWECDSLSQATDKTQLDTKYVFTLAESCVPADLKEGLKLPQINVESGKYCIKGFEDLSPELLIITTNAGKEVKFPETVKAYVGLDTEPTDIKVNWKSESETVQGGASKSFDIINEKHTYKAVIVETDKYYLSKEMTDINLAAYTVPVITIYVMGTAEAHVSADYQTESENGNVGYFKTLTAAYDFINKKGGSGTIVIDDSYEYFDGKKKNEGEDYYTIVGSLQDGYSDSYFNEPEHKGMIIIKGNTPNATLKMHYRYYVNGPLMFKDITLQAAVSMKERIYARGNDLVMGTGLTCTWGTELTDGYVKEYSNALRIYGGTANTDLEGDTNIVILSGDYYLIRGGNEEGGTINGNTFVYLGGTAHTYYQLMGGSRKGTINGSTYVIVAGDAVADSKSGGPNELPSVAVFGGGLDGNVKADLNGDGICDGGLHVIINGGTVNAAVTGSGADEKYNGKTYVTVCGDALIYPSSEGAVFGAGSGSGDGSSNAEVSGDVLVNIFCNSKLAKNDYYAHVYGTNTSKNTNSDITMNVFDNANIEGSINGGAFVANSGIGSSLNDPKNVNVNVYGAAFVRLNVYGGSLRRGVYGDTSVSITENAVVKGTVYGGGQGAASVSEQNGYGSAINSSVYLSGNISVGDVYGGGNYGSNSGNSKVIIENASVGGSVYGGSHAGGVAGASAVTISGSEINGSVYGGNNGVGIIYPKTTASVTKLNEGTVVKGSVYGGGNEGESTVTNLTLENATVEGSVFGGSVSASARMASTKISENTIVKGDVFGSGKNGNVGTAKIEISSGFVNNVYGGGETAHADAVDITISGKEDGFTFDVSGEIDGLPKNKGTESEIASYFDSDSSYILKLNEFVGISGKTFNECASVESISNFSEVSLKDTKLTFNGTTVEYLEGITLLNLDNSTLELPYRTTLASAFTSGGVYSTAKQNVLPSTLNGNNESKIAMPSREMTDEEEISANGKIDSILKVYGKITGEFELFVDGEKKSGTYITSFHDGSNVGADIEKPTADYMFENIEGVRTGHDRNFAEYMANNYDSGAFKLNGLKEVHESYRVFTTIFNGLYGSLDGKNTSNWVIWSAEPYATISVAKEGENTIDGSTSPMGGVEFTIYSDKECTKVIETITTNAKGIAFSSELLAKNTTYYVKETKTKDNYILDETVYSVVLKTENSGTVVPLTENAIINHLKYGMIEIFKTSDDGVALKGVSFLVTGDNGYSKTIVTDEAGYATTGKILYGKYTIKEISNPNPGFEAPSFSAEVVVDDAKSTHTLRPVNNRVVGKVTLTKVDENGKALEGVKFNVYSDAALKNLVDTIITNANGYAETKALTIYGESTKYFVVEVVTLDEYVLRDDDIFEVTLTPDSPNGLAADEGHRVIKNYFKKANIAISKKGVNDSLLEGVEFGIYSDEKCENLVQRLVTDVSGSAVSEYLVLGTYYVKEISNPDKTYIVSDKVYTFELTESGKVYTETIYNVKAGAYISLEKIDSHGNSVEGVKFEIRNAAGELIETITTDANGKAISSALVIAVGSENVFTVKEVSAPDYVYINDTVFEAVLVNDNEIYELNNGEPIVNQVKEGYLVLEKENEEGEKLEGVEFTVYNDKDCKNEVSVIVTGKDGKGTSTNLPFGTYYVKETKVSDKSYVISAEVYTVVINEQTGTETNGKLFVPVSEKPIINFRAMGSVSILKESEDGKPLSGVEFTVYDSDMNQITKVYTDENGKAVASNLVIKDAVNGTKYIVVETATVKGFKLNETRYEAILKANGEIFAINEGKAIINYFERGRISLTKKSEDGKSLAGVEFTVYSDKECKNAVEVIVTDKEGKAISSALVLGTYYVKETATVAPFLPLNTVWEITLDEDEATKELTDKPIINYYSAGKITLIKTDENGKPLAGVEFTVYNASGDAVAVIVTDKNGVATSDYLSIKDANGTSYVVKETKGLDAYLMNTTEYKVVLKNNGETVAVNDGKAIVNPTKKGQISLTKEGEDGKPLAGVEFTIYSDKECKNAVGVIVTDAKGKAVSSALVLGTYYVKETATVAPFVPLSDVWAITLTENGETKELTDKPIVNYYSAGKITLIKTDENGKPLAGVEFTVYNASGDVVAVIVTDKNGVATTELLSIKDSEGTAYIVKETKGLYGYEMDSSEYTVLLKNNGETVAVNDGKAIINKKLVGELIVQYKSENDIHGQEVVVNVTVNNKPYVGEYVLNGKTLETTNGKIIVKNNDIFSVDLECEDSYVVTAETEKLINVVSVKYNGEETENETGTITEDNLIQKVDITAIFDCAGKITLLKTDENGKPLAGVEFTVYNASGDAVAVIVTDKNGVATTELLAINDSEGTAYIVKETKGLDAYLMDTTKYTVVLKNNGETVAVNDGEAIINILKKGQISLTKESEDGKPLAGVEFTIYSDKECKNAVGVIVTDAKGKAVSSALVLGTYYVKETKALDAYLMNTTVYSVIIKNNGETVAVNGGKAIINILKKGQISLTKESEDGKPLAGVEFTIYSDKECKNAVAVIVTDENGKAVSSALVLGTYYVKETATVAPFVLLSDVWAITLTENGETKELTNTAIINYYSAGKITLTKTDDSGKPLAGVEFTVYTLSGAVAAVIVTDENGVATTELLSIKDSEGTAYIVKETKGLYGYEMDSSEYTVLLKNNGETVAVNDGKAIINKKLVGELIVQYKSENDIHDQEVVVNVTVNDKPYVGEYVLNGETLETTNGKIIVKNNDIFSVDLECEDSYVVTAETEKLINIISVKYNGEETENETGTITEDNLIQKVDIIVTFDSEGKITLIKTDENGKPLAGVEFTVYNASGDVVAVIVTDENGVATTELLSIDDSEGTAYIVKETKGLDAYLMDTTEYTVLLKNNGETVAVNDGKAIVNPTKKGQISLTKESEDGKPLAGVEFTIYSDKECKNAVAVIVTDENGKAVSSALVLGTYYVKETATVAPFVSLSDVWAITLTENGETKELTNTAIINYYSAGKITLTKTDDSGKPLAGVEFTVYTLSGAVAAVIVTDENGVATTELLSIKDSEGTAYIVKETKGLYGYEMDSSEYTVLLKNNGETVAVNDGKAIINKKLVGKLIVQYKSENDINDQEVVVNVTVNNKPYVGEYVLNGETLETTDGKIIVKNNDIFSVDLECEDSYVVTAETEKLINIISVKYNGEETENETGTITEDNLIQKVDIIATFDVPAKPGDIGSIFFFSILAAISAFGLVVLQSKKKSVRG